MSCIWIWGSHCSLKIPVLIVWQLFINFGHSRPKCCEMSHETNGICVEFISIEITCSNTKQIFGIPMLWTEVPRQFIDNSRHFILHLSQLSGSVLVGGVFGTKYKLLVGVYKSKTIRHNFKSNLLFVYFPWFIHRCCCYRLLIYFSSIIFFEVFCCCHAKAIASSICIRARVLPQWWKKALPRVDIYLKFASTVNNSKIFQLELFGKHSFFTPECYFDLRLLYICVSICQWCECQHFSNAIMSNTHWM